MASDLDIHVASPEESIAAHRNVFEIWSRGLSFEEHLHYRLTSPSHRRATWFVGTQAGRVVVSLGCYPLRFRILGEELPGMAIGSVYTVSECRGQGFAPRLLEAVERHQRERHAALSVLYSDIEPSYYARLGYTLCPSLSGWREPAAASPAPATSARLVEISVESNLPVLMKLYADYHGAMPLSVARDAEYWTAILQKYTDDKFYALEGQDGNWLGYLRIGRKADAWRITDFALADQSESLAEALCAALVELAREGGAGRVGGWLPDSGAANLFFAPTQRRIEITMIKRLAWSGKLTDELIAGTSRFCEIDHV